MSDDALWGVVLIVYILPFSIWQVGQVDSIDQIKKLYPGQPREREAERLLNGASAVWGGGLVLLLAAWASGDGYPVRYGVLIGSMVLACLGVRAANKRWTFLERQEVRYWLAGSAAWVVALVGWFVMFRREAGFELLQFLLLAVIPPIVAAFAVAAHRWARSNR